MIIDVSGYRWTRDTGHPLVWQERVLPIPFDHWADRHPPGDGPSWDAIWHDLVMHKNAFEQSPRGHQLATRINDAMIADQAWRVAHPDASPAEWRNSDTFKALYELERKYGILMGSIITAMQFMAEHGVIPEGDFINMIGRGKHDKARIKKPKTLPDLWMEHPSLDPKLLKKLRRDRRIFRRWENSGHA